MKVSELKTGQGKVDVEVKVKDKGDVRTFNKYGKDLRVCNATVSDGSGDIVLSLWNDDIEKINVGDTIKISNGYVSEFNGKKQLSAGKFGKMEVISGSSAVNTEGEKPAEAPKIEKPKKTSKGKAADELEF